MRISTSQFINQSISVIQERFSSLNQLQQQISSGKRILTPADDPAASARILELTNSINATNQFQVNSSIATSRLEQEDGVMDAVGKLLQRVRELVLQGKNASLSATDRKSLASEVGQRLDELVGLANTRGSNGDYIFAGSLSRTQAFSVDAATGAVTYNGDQNTRQLQISADRKVADGNHGAEVFQTIRNGNGGFATGARATNTGTGLITVGSVVNPTLYSGDQYEIRFENASPPSRFDIVDVTTATTIAGNVAFTPDTTITGIPGIEVSIKGQPGANDVFTVDPSSNQSMFTTISNVINSLNAAQGNDASRTLFQQNMDKALTDLDQSQENLLGIRASIGARLKSIDSQKAVNDEFSFQMQRVKSNLEDVDAAAAIASLQAETAALQAAEQTFVKIQGLSLFNFIR